MILPSSWKSGESIHSQLKQLFRTAILAGEFRDGQALPTYPEISHNGSITEDTLRQAYNALIREGYARRIKKSGVYVHRRFCADHMMFKMTPIAQEILDQGYTPEVMDLVLTRIPADEDLSQRFERELPFDVVFCRRLYRINGLVIILMELYYPADLWPQEKTEKAASFYPLLIQSERIPTTAEKTLKAILLGSKQAKWLEVKTGSPGGLIEGRTRDQHHQVIEVFTDYIPAERYRFVLQ